MNKQRLQILPEIADRLHLSEGMVRKLVRQGRLQSVRICRRLLFDPEEVDRFLTEAKLKPSQLRRPK